LAFDLTTWLLIAGTFLASFVVIIIISNFAPLKVRHLIFGENVPMPALNVLIAFFGLSQATLPRGSFARFLLNLFIIWSIIIRTCYQGKLFEYLQGDNRKPQIKSINELMDRNFTYFVHAQHCLELESIAFSGR